MSLIFPPRRVIAENDTTPAAAAAATPALWLKCDEGSGAELADSSGNDNTCSLTNVTWTAATGRGTKPTFNKVDALGDIAASETLNVYPDGKITVMAWVYPKSVGHLNAGMIFNRKERSGGNLKKGYEMYMGAPTLGDGSIQGHVGYSTISAYNVTDVEFPYNNWYHMAMAWDKNITNEIICYKNGVEIGNLIVDIATGTLGDDTLIAARVGAGQVPNTLWFEGYLDDIRVYTSRLTTAQILAVYTATV